MYAKKYLTLTAIIGLFFTTSSLLPAERRLPLAKSFTPSEGHLASTVAQLFEEALEGNEFGTTYTSGINNDSFVQLSLEAYPQKLVTPRYKSTTPAEALSVAKTSYKGYRTDSLESEMPSDDCRDDGLAPLRLRQYASRHHDAVFPFAIKLHIQNWQDVTSLDFLYHPALRTLENFGEFQTCLYSLEVSDCAIKTVNSSLLSTFKNLTSLDLHNNMISNLVRDTGEEKSALEDLDLSDNIIQELGSFFESGLMWLKSLDLGNNLITQLQGNCFSGLLMVNNLNLAQNMLLSNGLSLESFARVSSLCQFFDLRVNFDHNCLCDFPDMTAVKDKLIELSLDDNPIKEVPPRLNFPVLRTLHLINATRLADSTEELRAKLAPLLPSTRIITEAVAIVEEHDAEGNGTGVILTTPTKSKRVRD